jgi:uncharacterized protein (TIGR03000 family)
MYSLVLAAVLTTGTDVPDMGRRGGCHGCCGGCWGGGCWGGCYGCSGCYGGCWGCSGCGGGCYGGCWGCSGCGGGCYGGCYGCGGGCFGYSSGGCYGCGGGTVIYAAGGGCTGSGTVGAGSGGVSSGGAGSGGVIYGGGGTTLGAGGGAGQGGSSEEMTKTLKELKESLEQLKKEQTQLRIEGLKQEAENLKLKATEQKIDELRRAIEDLKRRVPPPPRPGVVPGPVPVPKLRPELPPPQPGKGQVLLDVPADSLVFVNDKQIDAASAFVTPVLQPGQEYVVNVEAAQVRDGRSTTRVKHLTLRGGEVVRLSDNDMELADGRWSRAGDKVATPAHITVRLPADARLNVHGVDCPLTSETRTFDTPVLTPGKKYSYLLKAEVVRNGRSISQTQRISFQSGENLQVSFEDLGVRSLTSR